MCERDRRERDEGVEREGATDREGRKKTCKGGHEKGRDSMCVCVCVHTCAHHTNMNKP